MHECNPLTSNYRNVKNNNGGNDIRTYVHESVFTLVTEIFTIYMNNIYHSLNFGC